ncbi:MAG: efflux RND transporter periplasmic adaptor subunit [Melioribacteraceae bacterium]
MSVKKRFFYLLIIPIGIGFVGCSNNSNAKEELNKIIAVKVTNVIKADETQSFGYSGTIEESESVSLSFSVVGNVTNVFVSEGEFVKRGTLLAEINHESYKNSFDMAQATLTQAEDAYNRLLPMYKNGSLPEIKLVEVETGLQQAKAAALIAKKNIEDCKLNSPIDGIIGKKSIDVGMTAMPNFASINIVKIAKVFARVSVSENEISLIKKGDRADINIAAINNNYEGKIEEIGVMADPLSHTYKIKIGITNRNNEIKPGMICNANILKHNVTEGVVIPVQAIMVDELHREYVYLADNNKVIKKYIETGELLKNGVLVIGGLSQGERIVISGQQKLVDNSTIRIVN